MILLVILGIFALAVFAMLVSLGAGAMADNFPRDEPERDRVDGPDGHTTTEERHAGSD